MVVLIREVFADPQQNFGALIFGVGPEERPDAKTWLKIGNTGIFFQPSEIVKIGFIITFGVHIERLKSKINHPLSILQLLIHAFIPIGLVVISGDMGSALVFIIITVQRKVTRRHDHDPRRLCFHWLSGHDE